MDVLTTHVTVRVCHAELKDYLLRLLRPTYQGAKLLLAETSMGELIKWRNVHKSQQPFSVNKVATSSLDIPVLRDSEELA